MWIPSSREMYLTNHMYETEGAIYSSKYVSATDRVKTRNGTFLSYYTRSLFHNQSAYVMVSYDGFTSTYDGKYAQPIAIGFCTN